MSEELLKLLALFLCGGLGYIYAGHRSREAAQRTVNKVLKEEQDDRNEINKAIDQTSIDDLVRAANDRLRKRRSSGDDV